MAGAPKRFTHTYTHMCWALRGMREFRHLLGTIMDAVRIASDVSLWTSQQRATFEAALPNLLLAENSLKYTEQLINRQGHIKPKAMVRRLAFLFGVECVCGIVHKGLSALPVEDLDDTYRRPFSDAVLWGATQPLCPRCRPSFRKFCDRMAGEEKSIEAIELCAIAWLAERVKHSANAVVTQDRREKWDARNGSSKPGNAQSAAAPKSTSSEPSRGRYVRLAGINLQ